MKVILLIALVIAAILIGSAGFNLIEKITGIGNKKNQDPLSTNRQKLPNNGKVIHTQGLSTNTDKAIINLALILHGGVAKDGIPALNNPKIQKISESDISEETNGILVRLNGTERFYPYNILAQHEIVNDTLDDGTPIAVTFCPLCDTAIVFSRKVNNEILEFGVSGLLYESNLLMYDKKTESLWSQTLGKAVVGDYTGTDLQILPLQVISLGEVKEKYPETEILSTDTGYRRNYKRTPYLGYEITPDTYFPISVTDERYFAKEPFYVIPFKEHSIAFPFRQFKQGIREFIIKEETITISRNGDEITATHDNTILPGYFEFWFSWAIHHQEDGIVLNLNQEPNIPQETDATLKP